MYKLALAPHEKCKRTVSAGKSFRASLRLSEQVTRWRSRVCLSALPGTQNWPPCRAGRPGLWRRGCVSRHQRGSTCVLAARRPDKLQRCCCPSANSTSCVHTLFLALSATLCGLNHKYFRRSTDKVGQRARTPSEQHAHPQLGL